MALASSASESGTRLSGPSSSHVLSCGEHNTIELGQPFDHVRNLSISGITSFPGVRIWESPAQPAARPENGKRSTILILREGAQSISAIFTLFPCALGLHFCGGQDHRLCSFRRQCACFRNPLGCSRPGGDQNTLDTRCHLHSSIS